jgi:hypothetical protein
MQETDDNGSCQPYSMSDASGDGQSRQGFIAVVDQAINYSQTGEWTFVGAVRPFYDELSIRAR